MAILLILSVAMLCLHVSSHEVKIPMEIEERFRAIETRIDNQDQIIANQRDQIQELLDTEGHCGCDHSALKNTVPGVMGIHSAYGCPSDTVHLSCPDERNITVTKAEYGEYYLDCSTTCCQAHPLDCVESMESSDEDQWVYLKYLCDDANKCDYHFQGSTFVRECAPTNAVNYVSIYFSCSQESDSMPVGFSVYSTSTREYEANDIVIFDGITTNLGQYYQTSTNTFLCPVDGVYIFLTHIVTPQSFSTDVVISVDKTTKAGTVVDSTSQPFAAGSTSVVTECFVGQKVWVRNYGSSKVYQNQYTSFSGYLLARY